MTGIYIKADNHFKKVNRSWVHLHPKVDINRCDVLPSVTKVLSRPDKVFALAPPLRVTHPCILYHIHQLQGPELGEPAWEPGITRRTASASPNSTPRTPRRTATPATEAAHFHWRPFPVVIIRNRSGAKVNDAC